MTVVDRGGDGAHEGVGDGVHPSALLRRDPPAVGSVMLVGRLGGHDAGLTYAGRVDAPKAPTHDSGGDGSDHGSDHGSEAESRSQDVTVVMLTEGAESDSYARARFRVAIHDLEQDSPGRVVAHEDEDDLAPWVAFAVTSWTEGLAIGDRLLRAVTLEDQAPVGVVQGPQFRPHWWDRGGVGRWRLWPLPWPSSLSSAARWTFLASFAVICALAALALWIAVLVFRHQPPPAPAPGPGPGPNPPSTSPTSPTSPPPGPTSTPSGPTGRSVPPIV